MTLLLLLSALAADAWVYVDEAGDEVYTDDPSSVPDELRGSLRPLEGGDDDEEGGAFTTLTDDPARTAEELRREEALRAHRRSLEASREALIDEVEKLRRAYHKAANEHRKYKAGGRIGAADKAALAGAEAGKLQRELAAKEAELKRVDAQLAVLR